MQLKRILLTSEQLRNIPNNERGLIILLGHALNEINTLNKLLFLCINFDHEPKWRVDAHICQALTLARILVGKLNEIWLVVHTGYFKNKLSLTYDSVLNAEGNASLTELKRYFGRTNVINSVRNNFAFHYSLEHAMTDIPENAFTEDLAVYLHPDHANCLFHFAETAMNKALMDSINTSNHEEAISRLLSEISSVVGWLNGFAQDLIFCILEKYVGGDVLNHGLDYVNIENVPASRNIKIPYFIEISIPPVRDIDIA